MIRFTELMYITLNCTRIKQRIVTIATVDLFDGDLPCSVQTGFCLHRCGLMDGISFTHNDNGADIVASESLHIMDAVANHIKARHGWRVSIVYKKIGEPFLNIDLPLVIPRDVPIEGDVYIR